MQPVAVLLGGGVESTALVRQLLADGRQVSPVHVHCGLIWDDCESRYVRRFCQSIATASLAPLIEIRLPLHDFLNGHWAVTGRCPARRAILRPISKSRCASNLTVLSFALHRLKPAGDVALALGTTADNCYRDGSRAYFDKCEELFSLETGRHVEVLTPFIGLTKPDVIRRSDAATLALSFSCVNPRDDLHCGACIKCGRRQSAFKAAGVNDPTTYSNG